MDAEWLMDPRSGMEIEEKTARKVRKSKYYDRFTSILQSVPVMRTRQQAWTVLSSIYVQMDLMKAFRSKTNAVNADLAIRVAIADDQTLQGILKGSGCLLNRYFSPPDL